MALLSPLTGQAQSVTTNNVNARIDTNAQQFRKDKTVSDRLDLTKSSTEGVARSQKNLTANANANGQLTVQASAAQGTNATADLTHGKIKPRGSLLDITA